jgi:hypothetical protein
VAARLLKVIEFPHRGVSFTAVTMPAMSIAAREETLRYSQPTKKPTKFFSWGDNQ